MCRRLPRTAIQTVRNGLVVVLDVREGVGPLSRTGGQRSLDGADHVRYCDLGGGLGQARERPPRDAGADQQLVLL